MSDVDTTGPLPLVPPDHQPAPLDQLAGRTGWIPTDPGFVGLHREPPAAGESDQTVVEIGLGADPDLPWSFVGEADGGVDLSGPVVPPTEVVPLPDPAELPAAGVLAWPAAVEADAPGQAVAPAPPPSEEGSNGGPPAPTIRSRHGQPVPLSRAWNAGVAATIAVAAVVVGIIAFNHASKSSPTTTGSGPAFVLPSVAPAAQSPAGAASPPPGSVASQSAAATSKANTSAASAKATAPGAAAPAGLPAHAPSLTVLNETRTHGLAAAEAEKLRGAGWTVRRVTNVSARLTQTTVFYDASQEAAARSLLASVPSIKVALPRPRYLLATGGLIIVVASDAG